jgi:hypothetical protein
MTHAKLGSRALDRGDDREALVDREKYILLTLGLARLILTLRLGQLVSERTSLRFVERISRHANISTECR